MKRSEAKHRAILSTIISRMGEVKFTEAYIPKEGNKVVHALWEHGGGHIIINPYSYVVDSILHELIHECYPTKTERQVESLTKKLMDLLSDDEIKAIFASYQRKT